MSFILEALKRADRERRLERAPDLSAVYEENNISRHNRLRPWLWGGGSLIVIAIVVVLMLWPGGPGPSQSPLEKNESASQPPSGSELTGRKKIPPSSSPKGSEGLQAKKSSGEASGTKPAPRPPRRVKQPRPTRRVTEKVAQAETKSKPDKEKPLLRPGLRTSKVSRTKPIPVAEVKEREPVQPSPSASSIPEDVPKEPAASDQSKTGEKPIEAVTVSPAEPPPAPAAREQANGKGVEALPLVSELPYKIKEKLGKLQINVHSYSKDPAERLVFINMLSYKVGDKIGEDGPVLKEVTPDGVIIDYGEGEARLQIR